MVFVFPESAFANSNKAAGSGVFFIGFLCYSIKSWIGMSQLDSIGFKCIYILPFMMEPSEFFRISNRVLNSEFMTADNYRQSSHEFGFKAIFDKVGAFGQQEIVFILWVLSVLRH